MRYLILLTGVFSCAASVLFIKQSETDPVMLAIYRVLVAGILMSPMAWRAARKHSDFETLFDWKRFLVPGFFLSLHFVTWIVGARMTPSANATLIVNMTPAVMPLALFFLVRETPNRPEWIGTAISLGGVLLLGLSDFQYSPHHAWGDVLCFVSMIFYALYLAFGSRNRSVSSIYVYVVPVYLVSAVISTLIAMPLAGAGWIHNLIGPRIGFEVLMIFCLAVIPTIIGHSILNWGFRHIRGQTVSILNLLQFVFAGTVGYLFLQEVPPLAFLPAALLVVAGASLVVVNRSKN